MPPKGKKGKSEKKKSKDKHEIERPSGKETILQAELDKKVQELAEIKLRVYASQEENNWLNEEANKVRIETNEYMHFMSKKTSLRQTQIITLSDYHRQEIQDINRDKEIMLKEYQQKKEELRLQLMRKEQLLIQAKDELEAMNEYKLIQEQQNDEIKRLQHEITRIRGEHVDELARMKITFEKELHQQRINEDTRVEDIRRQANQEAEQFLYDRTLSIQNENVQLRTTVQEILKRTQALNELKQRLEEEQLHLIRRIKLATDLKKIRLDKGSNAITNDSSKSTLQ